MHMEEKMLIQSISGIIKMTLRARKQFNMLCSNIFRPFPTILNSDPLKMLNNMSKASNIPSILHIPLILLALVAASCEKVIDIDLNTADKKYVIEGNLTDKPGTARVLISQTKNFDE